MTNDIAVGFSAGRDLQRAAALEEFPIDSLWSGGHIASPNGSREAMVGLARLSAVTERVRIGTAILLLPLYAPAIVAKQITDLDHATGGRLVLGIGVGGEYPQEFRACNVPIEERGPRTNEAMELLRRLWTGERISHDGRFYPMSDVQVLPAPVQAGGPPIVVAGRQKPAMRHAALLGDGWMPYLYSPRRYQASADTIRELAAAAGRDLSGFVWYAHVYINVDPDGDAAREGAARTIGVNYRQDVNAMVDSIAVAGTPDEVTRKLLAFVEAGARHFIFMPAPGGGDVDTVVRRLLEEVVPAVREA